MGLLKVAIVGSTDLTPKQADGVYEVVEALVFSIFSDHICDRGDLLEIVSGGANGVDMIAESAADKLNIPKKIFLPEVKQWEDEGTRIGYKTRNYKIAVYCDRLICIRSQMSRTYGSGWTADRAEEMGKDVLRLFI